MAGVNNVNTYYYLNTVNVDRVNNDQAINFIDLLTLNTLPEEKLENSLHLTYRVDYDWLYSQYVAAGISENMTIISQNSFGQSRPNTRKIRLLEEFWKHHSKISIFKYSNNQIRIIILTANLTRDDWQTCRTQGLWVSPPLPKMKCCDSSPPVERGKKEESIGNGESPTLFKQDFLRYLNSYNKEYIENSAEITPLLDAWKELVKEADFSAVNVFFLGSVPGRHVGDSLRYWGHLKLAVTLQEHVSLPTEQSSEWLIISQVSSIAKLGNSEKNWLSSNLINSMSFSRNLATNDIYPEFNCIYPSIRNVENSYEHNTPRQGLFYPESTSQNMPWFRKYLRQWRADNIGRTRVLPHIKSYTRISKNTSEVLWFILTSANLSKGAWGEYVYEFGTKQNGLEMKNYEAGVLFLPKFVIKQERAFPNGLFRLPYDIPLLQYEEQDIPYTD